MSGDVRLVPHLCAALVAPAVDRIFVGAMAASRAAGGAELVQRYGGPAATGYLVDFRTRLGAPGGSVSAAGFAAVTRYFDPGECQRALDKQVAHGMICRRPDGGFEATERGRIFVAELYDLHARVTGALWTGHAPRVVRLVEVLGRLLAAATDETDATGPDPADPDPADPEPAFRVMAPPHEPDGAPPGVLLLNRLGALRYHRADAHAAAWAAAGHTARSVAELPPGPERLAIELETDRRAAGPYRALTGPERLELLADLAALPG